MSVASYEAKFHSLYHYATQWLGTEEERIWLCVKGLNTELQVLSIHMTSAKKSFNEVKDHMKKIEGVRQVGHAKVLAKKSKSMDNFSGTYSTGSGQRVFSAHSIQSALPSSTCGYLKVTQQTLSLGGQGASYSSASMPSLD